MSEERFGEAQLAQVVETLDKDVSRKKDTLEKLRTRQWRKSEIDEYLEHLEDLFGMNSRAMRAFVEVAAQAEAEGRVYDDTAPTLKNLLERFGSGAWILTQADVGMLQQFATHLDGNPPESHPWAFERKHHGFFHLKAPSVGAQRLLTACRTQERNAYHLSEHWIGLSFATARPAWTGPLYFPGQPEVVTAAEWEEARGRMLNGALPQVLNESGLEAMRDAQAERWAVLELVFSFAIERYRTAPEGQLTLPVDELLALRQLPGMRWESYASVEALRADLTGYRERTTAARRAIEPAWNALAKQNSAALRAAFMAAAETTSVKAPNLGPRR